MKKMLKKLITATTTLSFILSSAVFTYADEASNQEGMGNTDNNSDKSITMYYGDFDYDGEVTLKDATRGLKLAVGISENKKYYEMAQWELIGDIDGDGITLTDATEYLRMAVGIIPPKEGDFSISFEGELKKFTSEDGKVEALYIDDGKYWKYIKPFYYYELALSNLPEGHYSNGFDDIFFRDFLVDENTSPGMKLTMMEVFDTPLSDLYNYNYFYLSLPYWCETLGYDNFKISLENTDTTWKIKVDNSSPVFYEELSSKDILFRAQRDEFFFRVPKSESFKGKEILGELNQTYGAGFENPQDIEWSFEKLDNIDEATQSACLITNESAAPENIKDKCDFDNYDYILLTLPFNVEDCFDHYHHEVFSSSKTVKEMYDSGDIGKPDGFDAATYLNDKIWLNEDSDAKVVNLKSLFSIYERCYYEDIGNCGTALIKVEKGKYDGYKFNLKVFGNENLSIYCMD